MTFINYLSHCIDESLRWEPTVPHIDSAPFHATRRFIVFETARHLHLSWSSLIHFELCQTILLSILISSHLPSGTSQVSPLSSVCSTFLPILYVHYVFQYLKKKGENSEVEKICQLDRQLTITYRRNIEARTPDHCCRRKTISVTYCEWVCVFVCVCVCV